MLRVQRGELDALAELVRRYQAAMLHVAGSRLGRRDWAEEVVQETFLAVIKSRAAFDPAREFRPWLWTILFNQCHRHFERRSKRPEGAALGSLAGDDSEPPRNLPSGEPTPLAHALENERRALLESLLTKLKPGMADALRLRFYAGLKFREIAEVMQCSLATAKNRVRAGLTQMAEELEQLGYAGKQHSLFEVER